MQISNNFTTPAFKGVGAEKKSTFTTNAAGYADSRDVDPMRNRKGIYNPGYKKDYIFDSDRYLSKSVFNDYMRYMKEEIDLRFKAQNGENNEKFVTKEMFNEMQKTIDRLAGMIMESKSNHRSEECWREGECYEC